MAMIELFSRQNAHLQTYEQWVRYFPQAAGPVFQYLVKYGETCAANMANLCCFTHICTKRLKKNIAISCIVIIYLLTVAALMLRR